MRVSSNTLRVEAKFERFLHKIAKNTCFDLFLNFFFYQYQQAVSYRYQTIKMRFGYPKGVKNTNETLIFVVDFVVVEKLKFDTSYIHKIL